MVLAVYALVTVVVPTVLARAQFLKATADGLLPSSRFAGTVFVFSVALVALVAVGALYAHFSRENTASLPSAVNPPAGSSDSGWRAMVERMERDQRQREDQINDAWRTVVDQLKAHNALAATTIGERTKEIAELKQELDDTRPVAA